MHTAHSSIMQQAPGTPSHPQLRKLQQALAEAQETPQNLIGAVGHQLKVPHLPLSGLAHLLSSEPSDYAPSEGSNQSMQQAPDLAPTPRKKSFGKQFKTFTKKLSQLGSSRTIAPSAESSSGAGSETHAAAKHARQPTPAAGSDSGSFTFATAPKQSHRQTPVLEPDNDAEHVSSLVIALQQACTSSFVAACMSGVLAGHKVHFICRICLSQVLHAGA